MEQGGISARGEVVVTSVERMNEADLVLLGLVQVDSTDSVPIALIGEKVGSPLCLLINYDAKNSLIFRK